MKLARNLVNMVNTVADLKAISYVGLSDRELYFVKGDSAYTYFANATSGDFQPNDAPGNKGWWKRDHLIKEPLPYIVDDTYDFAANNAEDITSIENWHLHAQYIMDVLGKDYKYVRARIKDAVYAKALPDLSQWNTLTIEEKTIAADWFVVPVTQRSEIYTIEDQVKKGEDYHKRSVESREKRTVAARSEILNRMPITEAYTISNQIDKYNLFQLYIHNGLEGIVSGDPQEGLFDYVEGTAGTKFDSNGTDPGFVYQTWTITGYTVTGFKDKIMDILRNGNY